MTRKGDINFLVELTNNNKQQVTAVLFFTTPNIAVPNGTPVWITAMKVCLQIQLQHYDEVVAEMEMASLYLEVCYKHIFMTLY